MKNSIFSVLVLSALLSACASQPASPPVPAVSYETAHQTYMQGDLKLAIQQLGPLAAAGDLRAERDLGMIYVIGGASTSLSDFRKGMELVKRAAEGGDAEAQLDYGRLYRSTSLSGNAQFAHGWFQKAADQGLAAAEVEVGEDYLQGRAGYVIDASALEWFNKAATAGDPAGLYYLGYMYLNGIGVTLDHDRGIALLQEAAKKGDRKASLFFALCYRAGNCGFPADAVTAQQYFTQASDGVVQSLGQLAEAMKDIIDSHKLYPKEAVMAGQSGLVVVSFECPDRNPSHIHVDRSSGVHVLDTAAVQAVADSYFPARVPALDGEHHFVVGVDFQFVGGVAPAASAAPAASTH